MILEFLIRWLPYKEIGWKEINEVFYRFQLLKSRFGNVYLHRLVAPISHPQSHDHPWDFVAIILWGGYWEEFRGYNKWRRAGTILHRKATDSHNVVCTKPNWSLVITGPKKRDWGFVK